jgi:hypothetical protein
MARNIDMPDTHHRSLGHEYFEEAALRRLVPERSAGRVGS